MNIFLFPDFFGLSWLVIFLLMLYISFDMLFVHE